MENLDHTFALSADEQVIIYGAGAYGQNIYGRIKNIYDVKCFIDRRAYLINGLEIPVYDLSHMPEHGECVVIVCVHNANWHYKIAEDLYALGFEKIVFLALSDVYMEKQAVVMNRIYNLLIEEQYDNLDNIPYYRKMRGFCRKENIIRENGSFVTVWCGKDMLYSCSEIAGHYRDRMTEECLFYYDSPMIANKPYISLFRFFMYGTGSAALHIKVNKLFNNSFEMSDEKFLQDQYGVYCLLEEQFAKGADMLQYMPIDVTWNERGYFNIIDGQHRCAFYWLKGMQKMPVRMKKEDYAMWMNDKCLDRVKELLYGKQMIPAVRINHPVLQECKGSYTEYEITVLDILQEWLYDLGRIFQSVLELSRYQAYYGRHFYKMRKGKKIVSVVGAEDAELAYSLCELQYIPGDALEIAGSLKEVVDRKQGFELGLVCGIYDIEGLQENLGRLNTVITEYLFWQSELDTETEKKYILEHSDFSQYTYLATKCFCGRSCEIGVFTK